MINILEMNATNEEVISKINEIVEFLNAKETKKEVSSMTENDARRVMFGDLKEVSHKIAAEKLNLTYGQVYSARKGFTFKSLKAE